MSVKYQDYKVIKEETDYMLQKRVNDHLQKGWIPTGGISITYVQPRHAVQYAQALILPW